MAFSIWPMTASMAPSSLYAGTTTLTAQVSAPMDRAPIYSWCPVSPREYDTGHPLDALCRELVHLAQLRVEQFNRKASLLQRVLHVRRGRFARRWLQPMM